MPFDVVLLLEAAAGLEQMMSELRDIRTRTDPERAKALVALRRRMAAEVAHVASVVRPMIKDSENRASTFGHLYSTLLTRLALHQANWSAVRVFSASSMDDEEYRCSALTVDEANAALIGWLCSVARADDHHR